MEANGASGGSDRPKRKWWKSKKLATSNTELRIKEPEQWRRKVTKEDTIQIWSEKSALRFTAGVSTVVACLFPIVAITALSNLHRTRDLLLCLAGFTVIFAVGLMFLTHGTTKRVEIFTATAA
jgi:cytochrome c biogenesis protein CcdA